MAGDEEIDFKTIERPNKRKRHISINGKAGGKRSSRGDLSLTSPSSTSRSPSVPVPATPSPQSADAVAAGQCKSVVRESVSVGLQFCPLCQFPFKYLVGQTERWHLNECLERLEQSKSDEECPYGIKCNSISQSHYRKYSHTLQALDRSGGTHAKELMRNDSTNSASEVDINDESNKTNAQSSESKINPVYITNQSDDSYPSEKTDPDPNVSSDSIELFLSEDFNKCTYEQVVSEIVEVIESQSNSISSRSSSRSTDSSVDAEIIKSIANLHRNNKEITPLLLSHQDDDARANKSGIIETDPDRNQNEEKKPSVNIDKIPVSAGRKKLLQAGVGAYFGLKNEVNNQLTTEDREKTNKPRITQKQELQDSSAKSVNAKASYRGSDKQNYKQHKRQCPFYKKIPDTAVTVDAFSYGVIPGCKQYFLSHFHYDHYGGLKKSFSNDIYCSKVTAALVRSQIKVDSKYIHSLPMNEEINIDDMKVTLLDANHCPGSVMFVFRLKNGKMILHTGDFRACRHMIDYPALSNVDIDSVYLDTTYCHSSYNFPTQQHTIDFAVKISREAVLIEPKTLIVCGTYSIGKERVFVAIANSIKSKICVKADKKRILSCLDWEDINSRLTSDWKAAQVHVLPMNSINFCVLQKHLDIYRQFKKVIAFKPTGWTFTQGIADVNKIKPKISNSISIYGIPYSEHSSFSELEWFVKQFKPKKIIPTVNVGSPKKRNQMQKILTGWSNIK